MTQEKQEQTEGRSKQNNSAPKKRGAPCFVWTEEIENDLMFRVSTQAKSVTTILREDDRFPKNDTFYKRLLNDKVFAERYDRCKRLQQDVKIEEQNAIIEEVKKNHTFIDREGNVRLDSAAVALAKLQLDNIKWEAARLARVKWGDKQEDIDISLKSIKDDIKKIVDGHNPHEKEY